MPDTAESRISIRLKPELNALLDEHASRRKITKSRLVNELLSQALNQGPPDAWGLLQKARSNAPGELRSASQNAGRKMAAELRAKHAGSKRPA